MSYQPIFQTTRGRVVESMHYGAIAVADRDGRLVAWHGDPEVVTFLRSSAKPLQALPLLESGAADAFGLNDREIALICASHTGREEHLEAAASIQRKAGVSEADLKCGVHPPYDREAARRLEAEGADPRTNHHNCSGKHSGMLALALHIGAPLDGYLSLDHPVQQRILAAVAEMAGLDPAGIEIGVDGCSAPNFALSLRAAATAFARLADPSALPAKRAQACSRLFRAMIAHPEMVSGRGRFDTRLMQATGGRLLAKGGAEGYQAVGLPAGALGEGARALGVAIKVSDGNLGRRALPPVVLETLRALGGLTEEDGLVLEEFHSRTMTNDRGLSVGTMAPCFELQWAKA